MANTPVDNKNPFGALKKEIPEGKSDAIKRRLAKKKQEDAKKK
jgi:hypothetical protein